MTAGFKYTGYHSTSVEFALAILSEGFHLPKMGSVNDMDKFLRYWLGPGIYFFEDEGVARWWSNKPSKTYGVGGEHVILQSKICPKNVLDLRKVTAWNWLVQYFDGFMGTVGRSLSVEIPDKKTKEYIRCIFFTWLQQAMNYDMIIAAFNQDEFQYLDMSEYSIEKEMDIYYTEVQYCVYDQRIICNTKEI